MEFKIIDIKDIVNENDLIPVIEENIKVASLRREQIKKMQQASKPKTVIIDQQEEKQERRITEDEEDFEEEVGYYLTQLKELQKEELEESLPEVLPVKRNKNYKKIILRLILESLRNIHEMEEVLDECSPEEDQEDIAIFKEEIEFEKHKIELLRSTLEEEKEEIIENKEDESNNLIFVPTSGGSIRVLDEIDKIPEEYYELFITLFNSIKDGTFKNVKRFVNNNALNGICEVKDFKVRVVFARLNQNSYAILTAFVKKTQNDKGYIDGLKNKIADYRIISDILKRNLENEEFMQMQKTYEQELYRKLGASISSEKTFTKGDK